MGTRKRDTVPVTMRAVIQRINRRLKREHDHGERNWEFLKATRGDRWRSELGDYYLVNVDRNAIVDKQVDPEEFARELGVLAPYERVEAL